MGRPRPRASPPRCKELGLTDDGKVASYLYNSNEYMEGVFATWKCGGGPVNVNYRYLEEELTYLLTNSDTEILLFHGSLGDQVAKVTAQIPTLKAIVQVDDGSPLIEGALRFEDLIAANARAARRDDGRRPLHPLHRRHHGDAEGRHVAQRGPVHVADPVHLRARGTNAARGRPGRHGSDRGRTLRPKGGTPVHLPASPLMHGTGFMSSLQALSMGGTIVTLESRHFDPDELWHAVVRNHVTQMAIVGDTFGKPMVHALETQRRRQAVRPVVARRHHQLRRDVDRRGEGSADGARRLHLPGLARVE